MNDLLFLSGAYGQYIIYFGGYHAHWRSHFGDLFLYNTSKLQPFIKCSYMSFHSVVKVASSVGNDLSVVLLHLSHSFTVKVLTIVILTWHTQSQTESVSKD